MRLRRFLGYPLVIALPLLVTSLLTLFSPYPLPRLSEIVFDSYQRWHAQRPDPDSPVRIVAIDTTDGSKISVAAIIELKT